MSDVASGYETIIGLEIHVQLKTRSKMFCGCAVEFGAPPNTLVCPVCLGLPGALPVVNGRAVELAVLAALALNCEIHPRSVFARKNYFYPDLPKGYQISQYDRPLATRGWLEVPNGSDAAAARIRVRRIHVEEDSGKSLHDRYAGLTAVDLNRAGVALAEIVTEPDLRSPAQARAFLARLKQTLEYIEVSDCNMEEGSLRVDANVSVRPPGVTALATKTELKNMNSFSQLERALEFEAARHLAIVEAGGAVIHQTMLWDPARNESRPMRGKEELHDYRYFPEPDLPDLVVPTTTVSRLAEHVPELPWQKQERFARDYALTPYDAGVLSASRTTADYYEAVARISGDPRSAANWVMREALSVANKKGVALAELGVEPARLAELMELVAAGELSHSLGAEVLNLMAETGQPAALIVEERNLRKIEAGDQLDGWVEEALAENPEEVERFRAGEEKLLTFFIGQVMRKSRGRADAKQLRARLLAALEPGKPDAAS